MTEPRPRPELVTDDHPGLAQALRIVGRLSPDEQAQFLATALRAVYTFQKTGEVAALEVFATDTVGTMRLRSRPGYERVLRNAADHHIDLRSVGSR